MLPGFIVGLVAEWLRRGLQILAPRFDSGRGLQSIFTRGGDPSRIAGLSQGGAHFRRNDA
jgi:hypothetical protein